MEYLLQKNRGGRDIQSLHPFTPAIQIEARPQVADYKRRYQSRELESCEEYLAQFMYMTVGYHRCTIQSRESVVEQEKYAPS